ncbi:MAG: ribonuclease D [Thermodesulforhabdaceae bacterium]
MKTNYSPNDGPCCVGSSAVFPPPLEHIEIITTDDQLRSLARKLRGKKEIAVDTESNGFYAYYEKTCLIQLSDGAKNYIIDPLSVKACSILGEIFSDPGIEKILHHGVNDISGLKHDFGLSFAGVFDTSIAAQLLGIKRRGLAFLLSRYFNISISKKGQHHDWSRRPLDEDWLIYAAVDVFYLIPLAARMKEELEKRGLLERAYELSRSVANRIVPKRSFSERGYTRINGYRELGDREKRIVRRLYRFRDELARQWDRAPFRVLADDVIVKVAIMKPRRPEDLEQIKGIPVSFKKGHYGERLIQIVEDSIL